MNNSQALNVTYVEECKILPGWNVQGRPVKGMTVFWLLVCLISTLCNSATVYAVRRTRNGHFRTFDICVINLLVAYLIPGNIMYISMAAFNIDPLSCSTRNVLGLAFNFLTFVKILTLIVVSFNQAAILHRIARPHNHLPNSNSAMKRAIKVSVVWPTAALLVLIVATTTVSWYLLVSIFVIILGMIRVYVIRKLSSCAQLAAGVNWRISMLQKAKKSKRMTLTYFMIELVTWIPAIVAVVITRIASKDAVAVVSRYAFLPVFLSPTVYAIATIYGDSDLRSYVRSSLCQRSNNQVQGVVDIVQKD